MPTAFGQLVWPLQGGVRNFSPARTVRIKQLEGLGFDPAPDAAIYQFPTLALSAVPPYLNSSKTVYYAEPQLNHGGFRNSGGGQPRDSESVSILPIVTVNPSSGKCAMKDCTADVMQTRFEGLRFVPC